MNEDITELALEQLAEIRMNRNQEVRERLIVELAGDDAKLSLTASDPKQARILLTALKDADDSDLKRMGLKQNERELDTRERVLSFMENITSVVKGNPFYNERPMEGEHQPKGRPETFYDKDDFVEGELEIETNLSSYQEFMSSRNALPNSANLTDNDSDS